ncbi:uncharacterized protein LOC130624967 isoform X3 [Hydractinia symbiolongicarpus]|uniref:uncharacterized protein LOC130624967 isoform X3 n=1 Tax=Hydractinia symbiolongicarpus TaxID=13093 RepID=UPI00254A043E|nr:uncharacterized protein LOC130624967 isoform X3 [Hydractinia symbiolongicarpus]
MAYQVGNVPHPNKKENTILFSIFEGKDTTTNLRVCFERFRPQIKMLEQVKYKESIFRVFMYGDYEFLCAMYVLTGANVRHSCLFYTNEHPSVYSQEI